MRQTLKSYSIFSFTSKELLYQAHTNSLTACIEQAVRDNVSLKNADLRKINLSNATLDGADLKGAQLSHSNLTGANLSESNLEDACLCNTSLFNTCLAYTDLTGAAFEGASFGATDITGAILKDCIFSTTSCFTLDFVYAGTLSGCIFKNPDGVVAPISCTPIIIKGLPQTIIFLDRHIKIDNDLLDHDEWMALITAKKQQSLM